MTTNSTNPPSLVETVTFMIHAIKQLSWGFDRLHEIADEYQDGSAAKAFYLNAIYNYLAVLYLLDRGNSPVGGAFYGALQPHGLQHLLTPVTHLLAEPMGTTTLGEVIRVVRNKVVAHPGYRDADLERLYTQVNLLDSANQHRFHSLLVQLASVTRDLAWALAKQTGLPPEHFGMRPRP